MYNTNFQHLLTVKCKILFKTKQDASEIFKSCKSKICALNCQFFWRFVNQRICKHFFYPNFFKSLSLISTLHPANFFQRAASKSSIFSLQDILRLIVNCQIIVLRYLKPSSSDQTPNLESTNSETSRNLQHFRLRIKIPTQTKKMLNNCLFLCKNPV